MRLDVSRSSALLAVLALVLLTCGAARAGGGPENVVVVVNSASWASQTVANEFIHLRRIPSCNVIYLSLGDLADFGLVDIDYFRTKVI